MWYLFLQSRPSLLKTSHVYTHTKPTKGFVWRKYLWFGFTVLFKSKDKAFSNISFEGTDGGFCTSQFFFIGTDSPIVGYQVFCVHLSHDYEQISPFSSVIVRTVVSWRRNLGFHNPTSAPNNSKCLLFFL